MSDQSLQALGSALRCPMCHEPVRVRSDSVVCTGTLCAVRYPRVDGVPVLINENNSVFSIDDFQQGRDTTFKRQGMMKRLASRLLPGDGLNVSSRENYQTLTRLLAERGRAPRVLVIGGGAVGDGSEVLLNDPGIEVVLTDVSRADGVSIICDAHDLPFDDHTFDGVIAQAVLEHVVDPVRCASEMHRVLRPGGLVYAETPFMQQVHMGRYDFTRFTHLGHRRLLRQFEEVGSGVACGPGMALGWAYEYFLISFTAAPPLRGIARVFARLTSFPLKYFDYFLARKPGAFDSASGFWFLGRKSDHCLSDRELVRGYKGAQ